jgi:pimeloyl-ACP methyl ester carboxylesterase
MTEYLKRDGHPFLAYDRHAGDDHHKTVIFLHGLWSDRKGTKAAFLAESCARARRPLLRFDFRGHGESGGDFHDATIGGWLADALDVIDRLTAGRLVLVGSSMGGWVSLLAARARPDRVAGFIGLAAAPDFTKDIAACLTPAQKNALAQDGYFHYHPPAPPMNFIITKSLLEEGQSHGLLPGPMDDIKIPIRLVHGMKDSDVPWQTAHRLAKALRQADVEVFLREEGDHRLSTEADLALLDRLVAELADGGGINAF